MCIHAFIQPNTPPPLTSCTESPSTVKSPRSACSYSHKKSVTRTTTLCVDFLGGMVVFCGSRGPNESSVRANVHSLDLDRPFQQPPHTLQSTTTYRRCRCCCRPSPEPPNTDRGGATVPSSPSSSPKGRMHTAPNSSIKKFTPPAQRAS